MMKIKTLNPNVTPKEKKGILLSRKGLGMELAMLVLLVVFACSTLLVTSALVGRDTLLDEKEKLETRLELDELADNFLSSSPKTPNARKYSDYAVWKNEAWVHNSDSVDAASLGADLIITDKNGTVLLKVSLDGTTVTAWQYF